MLRQVTMLVSLHLLAAIAVAASPEPKPAVDNWPSWRGPTANGLAAPDANPPITWDATTNIRWKVALAGRGSATPIVWGDQVFVVTSVATDREAKPEELPKQDPDFTVKTNPPSRFQRFDV